ncbi:hypothetical protein GCM10023191_056300 [Actinoallomurus oryzae]|uniref:RHS repeat-associated core domain-containing protein n=1 Tax=Actinoallomurus oryzae TaxID=502180 RepID=A0ABP8QHY7_9ACTN
MAGGDVVLRQVDVHLGGVLPLVLERTHVSSYREGRSFGVSWASTLDQRVELDADGACFAAADGMMLFYPPVDAPGSPVLPTAGPRWPLTLDENGECTVTDPEARRMLHFAPVGPRPGSLRLTAISDRNGNRIDLRYEADATLVEIHHSGGYRIGVETGDTGRVTALRLRSGEELMRYGYDDAGNLAEIINSSGRPLRFDYDAEGRLTGWIDRNGHWYRYTYDGQGRAVHGDGPDGLWNVTLTYGDRVTVVTDSLGHQTTYHLNELGQVIAEIDPLGQETRSVWDGHDRLLSRTDPLGRTTRYRYNEAGDLTAITRPDSRQVTATYNELGLPVQITDADGTVRRHDYDDRGNLVALTDQGGATTLYGYDERGGLSTITDPLGAVIRIVNDDAGLPIAVTDPLGATDRCVRDRFGRVTEMIDPLGSVTRLRWTVEGRPAERARPDGATERWSYDDEGNLIEYIDAAGRVARTEYGPFDLPSSRIGPDGASLRFTYDTELRLAAVTDPQGLTWRYAYDPAGNLTEETDFNGRVLRYAYDAAGQLTEHTNGAGQTIRYSRDPLGNVVGKRSGDAVTTFAYNATGRLVRAVNADVEVRFEHDPLGRVVAEVCNGRRLASAYDALGRRVRRRTPSGTEAVWHHDAAGRPIALHTAGQRVRFEYDAAGREVRRHVGDVATLVQGWEPGDRLSDQTLWGASAPSRPLQHRAYSYRSDGTVVGIGDHTFGPRRFELDAAGRVTAVHTEAWSERYTYDPAGKPIDAAWPATDSGTFGPRQYAGTMVRSAGNVRYDYDAQGRVVLRQRKRLSAKPLTWRYEWDADDRLIAVTTPGGQRWRYLYDALGRRIAKQRLGPDGRTVVEQTDFTWDGAVLAEQTRADGTTTWEYEPGGFRPIAQTERDEVDERFYGIVSDLIGCPTEMVGSTGDLAWQRVSTLWGLRAVQGQEDTDCPLRFPGQYHDEETGLHYNYRRYYDPHTGRYQSSDPLGLTPQPDPYAYVHNPTTRADPLGLAPYRPNPGEGRRLVGVALAAAHNRGLTHRLAGASPEPNSTVRDLLDLKPGNPPRPQKAENSNGRSDEELIRSVFSPRDGQFIAVHWFYPDTILQGNHRRYELLKRAENPDSSISWDTPIFINNFRSTR